jgi:hypothetical protein
VNFVLDFVVTARRTREAVRQIKTISASDRDRKNILTAWFQEHTRAAPTNAEKEAAYNELLGRARNKQFQG